MMAERKPFLLRIDAALHAAIARWADEEMRSLNGQIEFLLQRAVAERRRLPERPVAPARAPRKISRTPRHVGREASRPSPPLREASRPSPSLRETPAPSPAPQQKVPEAPKRETVPPRLLDSDWDAAVD
jgi:hypothetical protein